MYFWIGKRYRKNRCYVIFAIRLKRKKEERVKKNLLDVSEGRLDLCRHHVAVADELEVANVVRVHL